MKGYTKLGRFNIDNEFLKNLKKPQIGLIQTIGHHKKGWPNCSRIDNKKPKSIYLRLFKLINLIENYVDKKSLLGLQDEIKEICMKYEFNAKKHAEKMRVYQPAKNGFVKPQKTQPPKRGYTNPQKGGTQTPKKGVNNKYNNYYNNKYITTKEVANPSLNQELTKENRVSKTKELLKNLEIWNAKSFFNTLSKKQKDYISELTNRNWDFFQEAFERTKNYILANGNKNKYTSFYHVLINAIKNGWFNLKSKINSISTWNNYQYEGPIVNENPF